MKKYIPVIILILIAAHNATACRFTVREIGFSTLSQDIYTLAVIDKNANPDATYWKEFHDKNNECNIRLIILNPQPDIEHPVVLNARKYGIKFPATVLVAPDNRLYSFSEKDIGKIYSEILETPLGKKMRSVFPEVFAVVFWVEGKDRANNRMISKMVAKECDAINNILPGMPKIVKSGPETISVSNGEFYNEKLLLWSFGLDSIPEQPVAFVLYGRGRIMGDVLTFQQVMDGEIYKYLSMIGADCECGIDKKWMLGNQIPLLWTEDTRQLLTNLVGFDTDNPMILAEMSQLMAKESFSDASGSVAFAPLTIDLDEAFGNISGENSVRNESVLEDQPRKILIYMFLSLFVLILLVGGIIFLKRRN